MVKKIYLTVTLVIFSLWSCATYQPPPPSLYLGDLPAADASSLSLEERLIVEEGWQSLKQGNTNKAIKSFTQLGPGNPFYYPGLGYSYYVLKDHSAAEGYFKAGAQEFPDMILNHLGLGQIYQETGRYDLAFTSYREVLKIDPEHSWARNQYENIKYDKTREALSDGKTLRERGDTDASKTAYLKALYYSPQETEAHLALAEMYTQDKQYDNAIVHLKAATTNEPDNLDIQIAYADALFQSGNNSKSLEFYEKILAQNPDDQTARDRVEILKNRLGIFELPSQYDSIPAADTATKEQVSALIGVKFKSILPSPGKKPPIIIDISTSWASKYILDTASMGLMDVYPNHTFQPQKIVTRAEMAEILNRLILQLEKLDYRFIQQIPPERIQVSDVSGDNFYYRPIIMVISYNLMSLSGGRRFNPERPVTGVEAIQYFDLVLALIK